MTWWTVGAGFVGGLSIGLTVGSWSYKILLEEMEGLCNRLVTQNEKLLRDLYGEEEEECLH